MGVNDFVTRNELDGAFRTRFEPLGEIRDMLRDSIGQLRDGQDRLSDQVAAMDVRITTRMDEANHRTTRNEDAVDAATRQVAEVQRTMNENTKDVSGLSQAVEAVQTTATHIDQFGCQHGAQHEKVLTVLTQAGYVPEMNDLPDAPKRLNWTKREKKVAGIAALIAVVSPVLIKLIELISVWLQHTSLAGVK